MKSYELVSRTMDNILLTYMDWKLLRNLYVTENQSLLSEYTDLTLRIVVKQVELFVLVFLRVEKDLQSV